MEKEFYSINELAVMTGFSTRSLRNFIQMGFLDGNKNDGIWQFSAGQISDFLGNPNVIPGIRTKCNAVVYDFLSDNKKTIATMCSILDLQLDESEAEKCSEYFCSAMNGCKSPESKFKFERHEKNVRIIISGPEDFVLNTINGWYKIKE